MIPVPPFWVCFFLLTVVLSFILLSANSYRKLFLVIGIGFFFLLSVPTVSSILIGGSPARDSNNQIITDATGRWLYNHDYVQRYSSATHVLYAGMYLGFALIIASVVVLVFKASTNAFGTAHPLKPLSSNDDKNTQQGA